MSRIVIVVLIHHPHKPIDLTQLLIPELKYILFSVVTFVFQYNGPYF
jgi:hypothetical protein